MQDTNQDRKPQEGPIPLDLRPCLFDEAKHEYRRTADGPPLPGPTRVLKALGIIRDYQDSKSRTLRGTPVSPRVFGKAGHLMLSLYLSGELDEADLAPELRVLLDVFKGFLSTTGFKPMAWEMPLAHPNYPFAGSFDVVGTRKDGTWALYDYKFGAVEPWCALQTSAYSLLMPPSLGLIRRAALQISEKGCNLIPFDDPTDAHTWLGMLGAYHWGTKHGKYRDD